MKFDIKTPLEIFKTFNTNAIIEIQGNLYKGVLTIHGNQLFLNILGNIKVSFTRFFKFTNKCCRHSNKKILLFFRVVGAGFAGCDGFGSDRFTYYKNTENHDCREKGFHWRGKASSVQSKDGTSYIQTGKVSIFIFNLIKIRV